VDTPSRTGLPAIDPFLHSDLLKLFVSANQADVTFNVAGQNIEAHSIILAARSEYFDKMFKSQMMETKSKKINIENSDAETLLN
jgi:hypothetical protein